MSLFHVHVIRDGWYGDGINISSLRASSDKSRQLHDCRVGRVNVKTLIILQLNPLKFSLITLTFSAKLDKSGLSETSKFPCCNYDLDVDMNLLVAPRCRENNFEYSIILELTLFSTTLKVR